jgi:hypothetical protein
MLNVITKAMRLKFFLIIFALLSLFCCNKQNNDERRLTLRLDFKNSEYADDRFVIDSINVEYDDSIKIIFYTGDYQYARIYHQNENSIYEIRERCNEEIECFGTDTILTFSKSDTTFVYKSAYDFIPIVFLYAFADCIYTIKHEGNEYMTIKQSIIDTTYKEIFFYDKEYNIYKFVNTWENNRCVYVKRE